MPGASRYGQRSVLLFVILGHTPLILLVCLLGLLYLTMAQPNHSITTWAPLEHLDEGAALKYFKRGLEALIRDDFEACVSLLRQGIQLNTQNTPLNRDMSLVIDRVGAVLAPAGSPQEAPPPEKSTPSGVRTDFSLYGDPGRTKH